MQNHCKTTTSDTDILNRRWLPIDVDPVRPRGISSTDEEHAAALSVADEIRIFLKTLDFADPISADSGNGAHLLYRIDLPNDADSRDLIKRCLNALDYLFSDEQVSIDRSVYNAARIWKLYGTLTCKGDHALERPHRLARILEAPSKTELVSKAQLETLAVKLPEVLKQERETNGSYTPLDIEVWMSKQGLSVKKRKSWQGATIYELEVCPFNTAHTAGEARIIQFFSGALSFGCFHNSCQGKDWHALRDKVEPAWREKRSAGNGYESDEGDNMDSSREGEITPGKSQSDRLVKLIERLPITLFHDEYGDPYAQLKIGGHFEVWKIRSKQFRRWISKQFWEGEGKVVNGDSLNSALNVIEAKACFEGKEHRLYNRVAWYDSAIWYDLGNWKAVKVTEEGWEIVDDPPILFKRYKHQKAQAPPARCGEDLICELFRFTNLSKSRDQDRNLSDDQLLFVVSLATGFVPDIPHPINLFHGGQGTAKTTISRVQMELLDPSEQETTTYPKQEADFMQTASHN